MQGKLQTQEALGYLLAGKAIVTVRNEKDVRFTFKVQDIKRIDPDSKKDLWFVKVLTGSDNTSNYTFLGSIQKADNRFYYKHSVKSKVGEKALSTRTIGWLVKALQNHTVPERIELFHEGFCGRCGKRLTVPESIVSGYGPECIKHIGA